MWAGYLLAKQNRCARVVRVRATGGRLIVSVDAGELLLEADLGAFLDTHGDRVYTYLCVLCRDEDRAAEALQNAYIKFLEQVRRKRVRLASAPQYLQTIARNDYFGQIRKEGREVPLLEEPSDARAQKERAREEVVRELRLILLETVADPKLPSDVSDVMRLRFMEEASVEQICSRTGRSQATVYRLMEKALTVLAEACRKADLHPGDLGL